MSLRQRPAAPKSAAPKSNRTRTTFDGTTSCLLERPRASHDNSSPSDASPRKRIRLNRVLGRIVPLVLLVYLTYAYDLVVHRYGIRYLSLQQKRPLVSIIWLVPTHGLLLFSLRCYFSVFFAHIAADHDGSSLRNLLGATLPAPEEARQQQEQHIAQTISSLLRGNQSDVRISPCQSDGSSLRCYRDSCGGRIKPFRTRHCGDCGTCRVGFDHHCAWFDNDVASPATLRPFIGFLLSIPPLYTLGLAPLIPSAWSVVKRIHAYSSSNPGIQSVWWARWYSWIGGPAFRYMVGFTLGASRWSRATEGRLPHESPRAPVLVALGGVFVFVACALSTSSLLHLREGKLTIDVERQKAYRNLQRRLSNSKGEDGAKAAAIQHKMDSFAPVQHFKLSWKEQGAEERKEKIVSLSIDEGLLDRGSPWTNLWRFLGGQNDPRPAWLLSDTALQTVLEKACLLSTAQ